MLKKILAGVVICFVIMLIIGALAPTSNRSDDIKRGCEREFADEGQERVNECQIKLMVTELDKQEADKLKRAAQP